ncbi:MAG: glycosyltransferase [Chloroflexi bacterium]|nr:glycosyltransferase [Chloroflexota bacterium]
MQLERGTDNDMRILLVATTLTAAGLGSRVLDLAKALGRKGLDVAVASDTPETDVPVQELNRLGIAHYSVPLGRGASVTLARSVRALRRIILTRNMGLIHAFGPVLAWIAAMAGVVWGRFNWLSAWARVGGAARRRTAKARAAKGSLAAAVRRSTGRIGGPGSTGTDVRCPARLGRPVPLPQGRRRAGRRDVTRPHPRRRPPRGPCR